MSDKKNIDRLFQEKFKDFEVAPNDALWDRINESLPNKKKKRRVIALWWQIGGVAAAIALLFTVGVTVFSSDDGNSQEFPIVNTEDVENKLEKNNPNNTSTHKNQNDLNVKDEKTTIVDSNLDSEQKSKVNDSENATSQKTNPSNQLTTPNNSNRKSNTVANTTNKETIHTTQKQKNTSSVADKATHVKVANQTKTPKSNLKTDSKTQLESETERKSAIKKSIEDTKTAVAENTRSKKLESETSNLETSKTNEAEPENSIIETLEQQTIENAIAENNETIDEEEKEDERSRWSIAPNVAPVYFNSLGQGSSLDKQFNENSKSSDVNMSYGIAGSYAISKKLKIRTGVNHVNLNQTTSDVFAFVGAETAARGIDASFNNIAFSSEDQQVSLMSAKMMNRSSTPELFNTKIAGKIDQRFGFIEIPLELEYRLLDTKFGINVIGGFSTFFLSENEIYADINGSTTSIGEANNINDTSFSANFGLGMDYSLSKQWNINLEPTFKYQINTFNNTTGDFKPFFIGLYTGLSYKF
ncbi:hypothetical protein [Winogradskyella thalassocola]|uniref:Outer membrane protein beta-barrel domain-containing protein n=1 Tax=Winogradskyella thalassocola TaxID=262004 RepID=A0A1G7WNL5_9FLAO|nr:hypothetical protein [Winogradskyella thalassocola]SDG73458.1 hypothetical protein SAMN04489796_101435 [Winogradskyella thalassocola]